MRAPAGGLSETGRFVNGAMTFQEWAVRETAPYVIVHSAVLDFLRGRDDAVLHGALAVNVYGPEHEARLTEDVGILSPHAAQLAEELKDHLTKKFHIALRVGKVAGGLGCRIYQLRKQGNRHLVDVRQVHELPPKRQRIQGVLVPPPAEVIARKVIACQTRKDTPKGDTDRRDIAILLLQFPALKKEHGEVEKCLQDLGAPAQAMEVWKEQVQRKLSPNQDQGY